METTLDRSESISDGLDRAQIHESPELDLATAARALSETTHAEKHHSRHSIREKLSTLVGGRHGIDRVKGFMNGGHTDAADQPVLRVDDDKPAPMLAPNPFIDTREMRLEHVLEDKPTLPPIKKLVRKPVATAKKWASDQAGIEFAENIGKSADSHGASVNILLQEQKVQDASTENETLAEIETLTQLKQLRQDEFVRYSLDRHVRKIQIMQNPGPRPQRPPLFPPHKAGGSLEAQWGTFGKLLLQYWLEKHAQEYLDKYPQMDKSHHDLLTSNFERLFIASTPLQMLFMNVRSICFWEFPQKTSAYMFLYFFLVHYNQLSSVVLFCVLASIIYKRWNPLTLLDMRTTVVMAEDKMSKARHLTELITQHGPNEWMSHAIDEAAPAMFEVCEHMADTLEMMQNAYEWRDPFRTGVLLCILFLASILFAMSPTWLLVKASCYSAGVLVFIVIPLGRHYPRYRLLSSPVTWLFWKIPTHADWAIARVQAEGEQRLLQFEDPSIIDSGQPPTANDKHQLSGIHDRNQANYNRLIGTYKCTGDGKAGRLRATTSSISFVPRGSRDPTWCMYYPALQALHKISQQSSKDESLGLLFIGLDDAPSHQVVGLAHRDEVFSQILGYSGLSWKRTG